jgi:cell division protein FtsL
MIRVISIVCVGLLGFTCIANYRVSEQTRVARQELAQVDKQIRAENQNISVLELAWQKTANPETIQKMAEVQLGMANAPSVQLASVHELPRRGDGAPGSEELHAASADADMAKLVKTAMRSGM